MNARFDFNGLSMVITDDGTLPSVDAYSCNGTQKGFVGFQMIQQTDLTGTEGPKALAQFFMAPSHARAVASAMLSAAGKARE